MTHGETKKGVLSSTLLRIVLACWSKTLDPSWSVFVTLCGLLTCCVRVTHTHHDGLLVVVLLRRDGVCMIVQIWTVPSRSMVVHAEHCLLVLELRIPR